MAVTCLLLVATGLLYRSAHAVESVSPGFEHSDVLVARIFTPLGGYTASGGLEFYRELQDTLERQPGIVSVAYGWHAPLSEEHLSVLVSVPGTASGEAQEVAGNSVSRAYFKTLGVPILEGREFTDGDHAESEPVAIVNRAFAAKFWPNQQPVGRQIVQVRSDQTRRVVGVVEDLRYHALTEPPRPLVYLPAAQRFMGTVYVLLRTATSDPALVTPLLRGTVADLDTGTAVDNVHTLDDELQRSVAEWYAPASLAALLAFVILVLTTGGLYAVLTVSVHQQTREMAIRMAIGAHAEQMRRMVVGHGLRLAGMGATVGLGTALLCADALEHYLYDVAPRDAGLFLAVILVVAAAVWPACFFPAQRAATVDPASTLRTE